MTKGRRIISASHVRPKGHSPYQLVDCLCAYCVDEIDENLQEQNNENQVPHFLTVHAGSGGSKCYSVVNLDIHQQVLVLHNLYYSIICVTVVPILQLAFAGLFNYIIFQGPAN